MIATLILADQHILFREALRDMIENRTPHRIVGLAGNGVTAVDLAGRLKPDLAIIGHNIPHLDACQTTTRMRVCHPRIRIIILTNNGGSTRTEKNGICGRAAHLPRDIHGHELCRKIDEVLAPEARSGSVHDHRVSHAISANHWANYGPGIPVHLSPRETEVLRLVANGCKSRQIAEHLCISIRTVDSHREHIMKKLNVGNTAELINHAVAQGLLL